MNLSLNPTSGTDNLEGVARHRPYSDYKNSDVKWLREIPAHWRVQRLKYIATLNDETLSESTDPNYRMEYIDIGSVDPIKGIIETETLSFRNSPSRARRVVQDGDVIVSTVRTYLRAIAPIENQPSNTIVSTGFAVVRPRSVHSKFASYLLRSSYFVERVVANSVGVSYPAINAADLAGLSIGLPSIDEQRVIADFLDQEIAKTDALIAKKERLIELLQEHRSALIDRAVSEGLDPEVPMKDSGIEWLGKVPQNWKVIRLKHVSSIQTGVTLGKTYRSSETLEDRPYLRVANVQGGYLSLDNIYDVTIPVREVSRYELHVGDVLMTEGGDFDKLGRGYVWHGEIRGCLHQNHIFSVRPIKAKLDGTILSMIINSNYGRAYFSATAVRSTNLASTNVAKIGNVPIPLPPKAEQRHILRYLERQTAKVDRLVATVREAIERLKEARAALISATVTGRIDVRRPTA